MEYVFKHQDGERSGSTSIYMVDDNDVARIIVHWHANHIY